MAASHEAMEDLRQILAGRAAFYAKAEYKLNTSDKTVEQAANELADIAASILGRG